MIRVAGLYAHELNNNMLHTKTPLSTGVFYLNMGVIKI